MVFFGLLGTLGLLDLVLGLVLVWPVPKKRDIYMPDIWEIGGELKSESGQQSSTKLVIDIHPEHKESA